MSQEKRKEIYLDYAATTPVDPEVFSAMEPYWNRVFGNPGSIHRKGQEALKAVSDSREIIKNFLGAFSSREIIFTGSATEANNLAIQGTVINFVKSSTLDSEDKPHIITTSIEHESILEPIRALEKRGILSATYLFPDTDGIISPESVKNALRPETVLISIGYANNEIGVIQDIAKIASVISDFRNTQAISNKLQAISYKLPVFHTDAVQATQFLDMNVKNLGVNMLTLSAHKIYGPKGIGALYIKDGIHISPLIYGGGQEYGVRSGTENVPAIAGFAKAIELMRTSFHQDYKKNVIVLREYAIRKIIENFKNASLNGSKDMRLPNNINMYFPGISSEILLIGFSEREIYISSGAACSARAQKPSHVIQMLGKSEEQARSSIRITLGKATTKEDVDMFILALLEIALK